MPEFIVFVLGVATLAGGYRLATRGSDVTRKPPMFYLGWTLIVIGGTAAQAAIFYAMRR